MRSEPARALDHLGAIGVGDFLPKRLVDAQKRLAILVADRVALQDGVAKRPLHREHVEEELPGAGIDLPMEIRLPARVPQNGIAAGPGRDANDVEPSILVGGMFDDGLGGQRTGMNPAVDLGRRVAVPDADIQHLVGAPASCACWPAKQAQAARPSRSVHRSPAWESAMDSVRFRTSRSFQRKMIRPCRCQRQQVHGGSRQGRRTENKARIIDRASVQT